MSANKKTIITVSALISAPVEKVWDLWTGPKHIMQWNNASEDWVTSFAENDLRAGGKFVSRMEAKDGSDGFDFTGSYTLVKTHRQIEYILGDDRTVSILFEANGAETKIIESFEAEQINTIDLQKTGWQAILNNFKKYAEAN